MVYLASQFTPRHRHAICAKGGRGALRAERRRKYRATGGACSRAQHGGRQAPALAKPADVWFTVNRIREIREAKNLSGRELADLVETSTQQIYRLEVGERRLTDEWMQKLAKALQCHPFDLLDVQMRANIAEVTSFVAVDCRLLPYENPETVELPSHLNGLVAIRVKDEALWPRYEPGDLLLYNRPEDGWKEQECLGRECVVETSVGALFVKRVLPGAAASTYRLSSFRETAMENVRIKWASPITWVMRASGL